MPELEPDKIEKLVNEIWDQEQFAKFRTDRKGWDQIIHQEQDVPLPDLYKNSVVPINRSYEAQYAREVTAQEMGRATPVYVILSRSFPHERKEAAQEVEHFMNHQRKIWLDRPDDPYTLTAGEQGTKGAGIYKLDLQSYAIIQDGKKKYDIWPDRPPKPLRNGAKPGEWKKTLEQHRDTVRGYKLRTPTPFTLEYVPVMNCAWYEPAAGRLDYLVEKSEKPLNAVLDAYGLRLDKNDGRFYHLAEGQDPETKLLKDSVTFCELCTPDFIYHLVKHEKTGQGQLGLHLAGTYPNPFGAVRYVLAEGRVMDEADVTRRFQPLIMSSIVAAEKKSYTGTLRKFAAAQTALIVHDVVTKEGGVPYLDPTSGKPVTIRILPFEPIDYQLPEGTELKLRQGQAGADLDKLQAAEDAETQRYGTQDVMTGGSAGEREPAWGLALRGERAEHGIKPGLRGQNKAWRELARMVMYCVKNWIKEDVLLWGVVPDEDGKPHRRQIRVKPDDIEEDFDIDVDMGYHSTAIQLANRESLRRGKIERDTSRKRLQEDGYGVTDTLAEDFQIDIETVAEVQGQWILADVVEAALTTNRANMGLPPLSPEQVAMARSMVLGVEMPEVAQERRPATPMHTSAEAPPTPAGERII